MSHYLVLLPTPHPLKTLTSFQAPTESGTSGTAAARAEEGRWVPVLAPQPWPRAPCFQFPGIFDGISCTGHIPRMPGEEFLPDLHFPSIWV